MYQHLHWLHILRRQLRGTNSYSGNESKLDCQHGLAAVDVEFAVAPIHHILNDDISDFAFSFEYFEHFGH